MARVLVVRARIADVLANSRRLSFRGGSSFRGSLRSLRGSESRDDVIGDSGRGGNGIVDARVFIIAKGALTWF